MKVLSIIRFKPKPKHLEDVIKELRSHNQRCRKLFAQQRFLSEIEGEIYLLKISPSIEKIQKTKKLPLSTQRASGFGLTNGLLKVLIPKIQITY